MAPIGVIGRLPWKKFGESVPGPQPSARGLACSFECGHLFANVPHEKHRTILREESCRTGIGDRNGKPEPALGLIPKLSVAIETESYLLIVNNHFLQRAHDVLLLIGQSGSVTIAGPFGPGGTADRAEVL